MGFFHVMPEKSSPVIKISSGTKARLGCASCTLDKAKLKNPKIKPTGAKNPTLYLIAEAPGETEDEMNEQMVGRAGQFIRSRLPSKWKSKIRWNNVIRCRPPGNREPTNLEIECCRKLQIEDIVKSKPEAVVGFGSVPLEWFTGKTQIRDIWRGRKMAASLSWQGETHKFWYYPMLHPSFVVRMGGEGYRGADWADEFSADLARMFNDAEAGFGKPTIYTEEEARARIKCWTPSANFEAWMILIKDFAKDKSIGLDIETTGLIPYVQGSKILTASLSTGHSTIAFPIAHPEAEFSKDERNAVLKALRYSLASARRVIAHSSTFEQEWLIHFLGSEIVQSINWGDSLAQAYTLDERKGGNSLDDLCLANFGLKLKSLSNVDVANLINEPLKDVLPYNALDAKFCKLLHDIQRPIIKAEGMLRVSAMHERRAGTMARLMSRGLVADLKAARKLHREYQSTIEELQANLMEMNEVKDYRNKGNKFNPNTPADVLGVLKNMGRTVTDTAEKTLTSLRHPFAKAILKLREVSTLDNRYTAPLAEGRYVQPDGRIHARFSVFRTSTGRPASEDPNMQNFPKRENRQVRQVIVAPPGHKMVACDYGQIEARVIAMASKDKNLIKYQWTDYDIHGHWLDRIVDVYPQWRKAKGMAEDKAKRKYARDAVKNEWTFPSFFGARLESRSGYLGIPDDILKPLDDDFWEEFKGVKVWQEGILLDLKKNRYVTCLTGRRRHWGKGSPLSPNEAINMPIQGTASDIVIDSMERLDNLAIERDEPWLAPVLNVHDDLTFYIPDKHMESASELIGKTMCMSQYPFINVPLIVEMSVGTSWDTLKEQRVFNSKEFGHKQEKK